MMDLALLDRLNRGSAEDRLAALRSVMAEAQLPDPDPRFINNHIHSFYSFSPYSPTAAVFAARQEGLCTAGIVDHDSMAGAREFIEAGRIADLPVTVGVEARISMAGTPFEQLRTNNPDQTGVSYMVLHAVPHHNIDLVEDYFKPLRAKREARNRLMLSRINELTGFKLDYERDVRPLSRASEGGSVTERHLMQALARAQKPHQDIFQEYDLIGALKKEFVPKVYVDADEECPELKDYIAFAAETGGILAYAYLGDVGDSVTGDKRSQRFEDAYLDELIPALKAYGVQAVTYMPTRNSDQQLSRLRSLCEREGLMQISGEDINSPRQRFVIEKMKDSRFDNLIESTWRLIAHEREGSKS